MSLFSDALKRLIDNSGISAADLAREVPCNPGHISRLRNDKARPSLQTAQRLDDLLDAGGELVGLVVRETLPADRPELLAAIGAVADPAETLELVRRIRQSSVDSVVLEALARTSDMLCTQYAYRDPFELRRETQQWLGYITGLLDKRTGLREHRELLVQAGWLTLLISCLEYDSGMAVAAEATRVGAMQLGHEAGHNEIIAWALEIAAWMSHTRGELPQTVAWARAGQDAARGAGVAVQLIAHEARSLGRMGDRRAVGEALDRGHTLLHGMPVPGNTRNHFVVDPAKFDFYAMDCLRAAGENDRAAEHARVVLSAGRAPDGKDLAPMRTAEARIALGSIAARHGDLDEAATWGAQAFTADRKCLPSLLLIAGELESEMGGQHPDAAPAVEFHDRVNEIRRMLPIGR